MYIFPILLAHIIAYSAPLIISLKKCSRFPETTPECALWQCSRGKRQGNIDAGSRTEVSSPIVRLGIRDGDVCAATHSHSVKASVVD